MKLCSKCKTPKALEAFYRNKNGKDGRHSICKSCSYSSHGYKMRKEQHQDWHLKRKFGISIQDYKELLTQQHNSCAICECRVQQVQLAVDHDHKTGKVRGLLCFSCNTGLGKFQDSSELLHRAQAYLVK